MATRSSSHIFILASCFLLLVCAAGCTQSKTPTSLATIPDPETGLASWIDAVNRQDLVRLYDLAPASERMKISEEDFIALNRKSSLIADAVSFSGYDVVTKEWDDSSAMIKVILHGKVPSITMTSSSYVPIGMSFNLTYEDGEWKIWEVA